MKMVLWNYEVLDLLINFEGFYNIWYPSETLQISQNIFVNIQHFYCDVGLKLCTEHGSITAVFCVQFQDDYDTDRLVMQIQYFAKFGMLYQFRKDILCCKSLFYNVTC